MSDIQPNNQPVMVRRETSITLRDVVYIMFRRRWIIAAITTPILIIASLGLFRQEGSYLASCQVLMELRGAQATRWNPATAHIDEDRELSTFQYMAMSIPVATMAAAQIQDSLRALIVQNEELADLRRERRLIRYLQDNMDVAVIGESNIFDIQFESPLRELSLLGVGALRDAFMEFSIYAVKNLRAIEYYQEQVLEVRGQIDSLLGLRAKLHVAAGYVSLEDDLRYESGQLADLRSKYYDAIADRKYLETKIDLFKRILAENPDAFPVSERIMESSPVVSAKMRVDDCRERLHELMGVYAENSIQVSHQRLLLAQAEEMFRVALNDYIQGFEVNLGAARQREETRRQQIEELSKTLELAPEVYHQVSLLDSELTAKRQLLKTMQVKSGEVWLDEMADERVSRLIKLTEPEIVMAGAGGKMFAYFALVSLFGFMFSIVVAFAIDRQDHKIYHPGTIEEHLDVPVLGVITDAKYDTKS